MASPVDTSVKHFTSAMLNAPVLNGTAGSLIAILDICLKDGFDLKSASSLTVANGVATLLHTGSHSATVDSVILVAGSSIPELNGEQRVTYAATGELRFATNAANGTDSGAVTFKMAPLGWTKPFAGTNLAAYRSSDIEGTGLFLRVDDTAGRFVRVVGYESMSGISTGFGPFPTDVQIAGGGYWPKSNAATTATRQWTVVGDTRAVYVCLNAGSVTSTLVQSYIGFFGDIVSYKSGDTYGCLLGAAPSDVSAASGAIPSCAGYSSSATVNSYIARAASATGGAQPCIRTGSLNWGSATYSGMAGYSALTYPNTPDNGLLFCKLLASVNNSLRGESPGIYHSPQTLPTGGIFTVLNKIAAAGELSGRTMLVILPGSPGTSYSSSAFFDITGPWR